VRVPDERVDKLSAMFEPRKTTYAQIQFVDAAAAGHTSARAAARGPDLFSAVRNCDALLAVSRDFASTELEGAADPARDVRTLEAELILNDLAIVESRIETLARELRVGKKENEREHALLVRCKEMLEAEKPLRGESFDRDEEKLLRGFQLLTRKPLLVVYNQDERATRTPAAAGARSLAVALRAHLEREIVALPAGDRAGFRAELGVVEDGLSLVIRSCYELLGLISFFTVGPDEVRAWTLERGETAVDAAGEIHSDLAKGFIRAEVVACDKLLEAGSLAKARERAWLRLEGREYKVEDGDCIEIRFNK
jgi:GTP-binding protein YchF